MVELTEKNIDIDFLKNQIEPYSKFTLPLQVMLKEIGGTSSVRNKVILDFACGNGRHSIYFTLNGGYVYSFDIQRKLLRELKEKSERYLISSEINIFCGIGENLALKDSSFDIVWGNAVLHHMDVELVGKELFRILKPGGIAVFKEPMDFTLKTFVQYLAKKLMVDNPLGEYITKDGASENHKNLSHKDLSLLKKSFTLSNFQYFRLLSRLDVFIEGSKGPSNNYAVRYFQKLFVSILFNVDSLLIKYVPFLKRFCSKVIIILQKK